MAVEIRWERQDETAIAIVSGRIDGTVASELQSGLESGLGADDQALILDFGQVSYINSSGLRVGLRIARQCRDSGKKFGICNLSDAARDIVAISGFDQVIPIFDSRNRALNQVSPE
jgi:anti-anti-sigma factor